ncbi:metallophosphoesterase [Paenibacillus mucilaginosus KNP414]|uniref:Metallophosphoesterase n=2 Tax=Paenibacillus mucilaginosus TaxID=61624 RepID=F8FN78_PAEMK|nr:metallophosphoesterase [Paenibacillus mucilaginosus KNP414]
MYIYDIPFYGLEAAADMSSLRFREEGTFKIVQLTDLHWKNGEDEDRRTYSLMRGILEAEAPDLVIFTGDVIESGKCRDPFLSYRDAVKVADEFGLPWSAVFGNHDAEHGITKEEMIRVQQESPNCLTQAGPEELDGHGNYVLEIRSRTGTGTAAVLYCMDSGEYTDHSIGGYDWIRPAQINWYIEHSTRYTMENGGVPVPSLAFFHIPLPEYDELWRYHTCCGHNYEGIGGPKVNSGMFASFLRMGDVKGVFVGHDHVNDFWGELHGIRLCYGRATGYNTYGREGFPRGARVIQLVENKPGFQSWLRLDDGSQVSEQPVHPPEQVWKRV